MPEHVAINKAGCEAVLIKEWEKTISITVCSVCRLLGEKEHHYECKIANMFWEN